MMCSILRHMKMNANIAFRSGEITDRHIIFDIFEFMI